MNKEDSIFIKVLVIYIISFMIGLFITIFYNIFAPTTPIFQQICEENNGTFIENHGRAGDMCIYSKGEENESN